MLMENNVNVAILYIKFIVLNNLKIVYIIYVRNLRFHIIDQIIEMSPILGSLGNDMWSKNVVHIFSTYMTFCQVHFQQQKTCFLETNFGSL